MALEVSNTQAKNVALEHIARFYNHSDTPNDIIRYIILPHVSEYIKMVVCLHLIIMFKDAQFLRSYLENVTDAHGEIICQFMLNFHITHDRIIYNVYDVIPGKSINSLLCATLWNTDPAVCEILIEYGVDVNSTDEQGLYVDDITYNIPLYYNHLSTYLHPSDQIVFGGRIIEEFHNAIHVITVAVGEEQP